MSQDELVGLLQALSSPAIAVAGVVIAGAQLRINRRGHKRLVHAHKIQVYAKIKRFFRKVDRERDVKEGWLQEFSEAVAEADFLFDRDVVQLLARWEHDAEFLMSELRLAEDASFPESERQSCVKSVEGFIENFQEVLMMLPAIFRSEFE